MLLSLTAALTWFGKAKHTLSLARTPELQVFNQNSTIALSYTVHRLNQQNTLVFIANQCTTDSIITKLPGEFSPWDLITLSRQLPLIAYSHPPKHWYTLDTTYCHSIHQSSLPPPENFTHSPFKEMIRVITPFQPSLHALEINFDRTSILYCTASDTVNVVARTAGLLRERYDLLMINSSNRSLCELLHEELRPYYTITSPLPDTLAPHPQNMISLNREVTTPYRFSTDRYGYITFAPSHK